MPLRYFQIMRTRNSLNITRNRSSSPASKNAKSPKKLTRKNVSARKSKRQEGVAADNVEIEKSGGSAKEKKGGGGNNVKDSTPVEVEQEIQLNTSKEDSTTPRDGIQLTPASSAKKKRKVRKLLDEENEESTEGTKKIDVESDDMVIDLEEESHEHDIPSERKKRNVDRNETMENTTKSTGGNSTEATEMNTIGNGNISNVISESEEETSGRGKDEINSEASPTRVERSGKQKSRRVVETSPNKEIASVYFKVKFNEETRENFYECPLCFKEFATLKKINRHYKIHVEERKYKCDKCDVKFFNRSDLRAHRETFVHCKQKLYECSVCNKLLSTKYLRNQHESTHNGIRFRCRACACSYVYKRDLVRHVMVHHAELDPYEDSKDHISVEEENMIETPRPAKTTAKKNNERGRKKLTGNKASQSIRSSSQKIASPSSRPRTSSSPLTVNSSSEPGSSVSPEAVSSTCTPHKISPLKSDSPQTPKSSRRYADLETPGKPLASPKESQEHSSEKKRRFKDLYTPQHSPSKVSPAPAKTPKKKQVSKELTPEIPESPPIFSEIPAKDPNEQRQKKKKNLPADDNPPTEIQVSPTIDTNDLDFGESQSQSQAFHECPVCFKALNNIRKLQKHLKKKHLIDAI